MKAVTVDWTKDIAPDIMITVRVRGMNIWLAKFWIAKQLFRLGARIANVGIEFEGKPE